MRKKNILDIFYIRNALFIQKYSVTPFKKTRKGGLSLTDNERHRKILFLLRIIKTHSKLR